MLEKEILTLLEAGHSVALITIIDKKGSAPRLPGSKMIVREDGSTLGTIGGGKMEHEACAVAQKVLSQGAALLTEFDMRGGATGEDADMICGGIQLLLVERIDPPMATMFAQALDCMLDSGRGLWCIDISDSKKPLRSFVDLRKPMLTSGLNYDAIVRSGVTRQVSVHGRQLVIDPLPKSGTLILVGGGHVSREVAMLASYVEFEVQVFDDREAFCDAERFPMARIHHVCEGFRDIFQDVTMDEDCYVLIITRGHGSDQDVLAQALRTSARYIGMMGSSRKRDTCYRNLTEQGFGETDFSRVHCPVGLSIGSETPKEIAVSIIAELIQARSGIA